MMAGKPSPQGPNYHLVRINQPSISQPPDHASGAQIIAAAKETPSLR